MYNPAMGVWTIRDPAQEGLNLYENVKSNPIDLTDPMGLAAESPIRAMYFEKGPTYGLGEDVVIRFALGETAAKNYKYAYQYSKVWAAFYGEQGSVLTNYEYTSADVSALPAAFVTDTVKTIDELKAAKTQAEGKGTLCSFKYQAWDQMSLQNALSAVSKEGKSVPYNSEAHGQGMVVLNRTRQIGGGKPETVMAGSLQSLTVPNWKDRGVGDSPSVFRSTLIEIDFAQKPATKTVIVEWQISGGIAVPAGFKETYTGKGIYHDV